MNDSETTALLEEHIKAHFHKPFAWGSNDCATFCSAWVETRLGIDFLAPFRPWASEAGAVAALGRQGYAAVADAAAAVVPEIAPAAARDGDILVHPAGPLALLAGGTHAFTPAPKGLKAWPRTLAVRAFHVGQK